MGEICMSKRNKKAFSLCDEKNKKAFDAVNKIFRNHPKDYIARLEEIGFEYHEEEDYEEIEERNAEPANRNQRELVLYFENKLQLSQRLFETYLHEKDAEQPNYPLFRRYFKAANQNLKALIIYGLDHYPGRIDLLSDLTFFHEFDNILSTLITYYTSACMKQKNLEIFTELVQDFYDYTHPDGYDALHALRELFPPETDKGRIIDFLIAEEDRIAKEASLPIEIFKKDVLRTTLH
jgi:hypothetical protein